ncbi:hypothetical protein AX17_006446 [Amanita inopinata Kibby_2008]|nr:hypothetical protein AX17_006446 [Amanita inopinata Kibby_2008]
MDGSTKNRQTCVSRVMDDISDDIQLLTDGTTEQDRFNFIIEVANALAFNLKTIPFAIMSDLEYRRSLDFLADYRNSLQNTHLTNAQLRKENCDLQKEIEALKQHTASLTTATKTSKTQTAKKTTPTKATMSSEQQAKMIANIISKHLDTSIEEAYHYSTMISEYVPWSPSSATKATKSSPPKTSPPPIPHATHPNRIAKGNNNNGPKSFAQVTAEKSATSNPWQTVKHTAIT